MHEQVRSGDIGDGDGDAGWDKTKHTISPRLIVLLVLAVLGVIFVVQNGEKTEIHFLFIDATMRVWAALLIAVALGVVLDRLFLMWWRRRRTRGG